MDQLTDSGKADNLLDIQQKIELSWYVRSISSWQDDAPEGGHTTHLCVTDSKGNAVSLSQTLGTFFGSGMTSAGVLLNTSMSNFSRSSATNAVAPGKQCRRFRDGCRRGKPRARVFLQKFDTYLHLEQRIGVNVREGLERKGHTLQVYGDFDLFFGGAGIIAYDRTTKTYSGSADPRRGGVAIGY